MFNPVTMCYTLRANQLGFFGIVGFCVLIFAKAKLYYDIRKTRNCNGVSRKTQILYAFLLTGICMNLDSSRCINKIVLAVFNLILLILSYSIVITMIHTFKDTYEKKYDKFRLKLLIPSVFVVTYIIGDNYWFNRTLVAFSTGLEAIVLIPQLYFIQKSRRIEKFVYQYIFLLTIYKLNIVFDQWINGFEHQGYLERMSLAAGVIMLIFCVDFLVQIQNWTKEKLNGESAREMYLEPELAIEMRKAAATTREKSDVYNENLKEVVLSPHMLQQKNEKNNVTQLPEHQEVTIDLKSMPEVHGK